MKCILMYFIKCILLYFLNCILFYKLCLLVNILTFILLHHLPVNLLREAILLETLLRSASTDFKTRDILKSEFFVCLVTMSSDFSVYKFDISRNTPLPLQGASQMQDTDYTYAGISLNYK